MDGHSLVVNIVVVVMCAVAVAAVTIWLATDVGVPSETAVPVIIAALFALRAARRHSPTH